MAACSAKMLSLEEAHWKLSPWPALCVGLPDRGVLREGYAADIVIYDYDRLGMEPSSIVHDLPEGPPVLQMNGASSRGALSSLSRPW